MRDVRMVDLLRASPLHNWSWSNEKGTSRSFHSPSLLAAIGAKNGLKKGTAQWNSGVLSSQSWEILF